nr:tetratricopeptide repeat protein [Mycolicibacterium sp. BK634]
MLGRNAVLTAAHVLADAGTDAEVVVDCHGTEKMAARVVWSSVDHRADESNDIDAVLLEIIDERWSSPTLPPIRWGQLVGRRPNIASEAVGYPRALKSPHLVSDTDHVTAHINPGARRTSGRYDLHVTSAAPEALHHERSPWAGMSGAGVFVNDILVAVIFAHVRGYAGNRLSSVPTHRLAQDPTFVDALADLGIELPTPGYFEPVELDGILDPLRVRQLRRTGDVFSPASLLRPEAEVVDFRGREELSEALLDWCLDDAPNVGVRLLTGPGGQGKTRLGRFVAHQVLEESKPGDTAGWVCGFLSAARSNTDLAEFANVDGPLLIVVDYAETRGSQLRSLLPLLWKSETSRPVRVILLARGAGDWWDELCRDLDVSSGPAIELGALDEPSQRLAHYTDAVSAFARHLSTLSGDPTFERMNAASPSNIGHARYGSPLTLQLAALTALLEARDPLAERDNEEVAERTLLRHEERYWTHTASQLGIQLSAPVLRRAVAAATLCGAESADDVLAVKDAVPGLRDLSEDQLLRLDQLLSSLYPPAPEQRWGTLQPDRIGEFLVAETLPVEPGVISNLLTGSNPSRAHGALTLLSRAMVNPSLESHQIDRLTSELSTALSSDLARLGPIAVKVISESADPRPMTAVLSELSDTAPWPAIRQMVYALPLFSQSLATLADRWTSRVVDELRAQVTLHPESWEQAYELGTALNSRFSSLLIHHRDDEAVDAMTEVVQIFRGLARSGQQQMVRNLAMGLTNLADALRTVGRNTDARTAAAEAVQIIRGLAAGEDPSLRTDLAKVLCSYSDDLIAVGDTAGAIEVTDEAVRIYRDLADVAPDKYLHYVAMAQSAAANAYQNAGMPEQALSATGEAIEIFRWRVAERPDTFSRDLALSLRNHAAALSSVGRYQDALTPASESVQLYRALMADQPSIHGPNLASALMMLSAQLDEVGRQPEGLNAAAQAVQVFRHLDDQDYSTAYRAPLANSLITLSNRLNSSGKHLEALDIAQEAVQVYRGLSSTPGDEPSGTTAALIALSNALSRCGRPAEALDAAAEATAIGRRFASTTQSGRANFATMLNNLSIEFISARRSGEAVTAARESTEIFRALAAAHPRRHLPDLAMALGTLSSALAASSFHDESLQCALEAVAVRRQVVIDRPTEIPDLALTVGKSVQPLLAAGRHWEALAAATECVDSYRWLVESDSGTYELNLAKALALQSKAYALNGQPGEALQSGKEGLEIRRDRASREPGSYTVDLADGLADHASVMRTAGLHPQAASSAREAVDLMQTIDTERDPALGGRQARMLRTLAMSQTDLGQLREALATSLAAVHLLRSLREKTPEFREDLALTLQSVSIALTQFGSANESLTAITEAVDIFRELVSDAPGRDCSAYALALTNQADSLINLGRWEEVVVTAGAAVEVHRRNGSDASGSTHAADLGLALNNLFVGLHHTGRSAEALQSITEAVRVYRALPTEARDRNIIGLARALSNQSTALGIAGRAAEALNAVTEAVGLYRALLADIATIENKRTFAIALFTQSNQLASVGRQEDALSAVNEAALVMREVFQQMPGPTIGMFATFVQTRFDRAIAVGEQGQALEAITELVPIYQKMAEQSPQHGIKLATALMNSAIVNANNRNYPAAVPAAREAIAVSTRFATHDPRCREAYDRAVQLLESILTSAGYSRREVDQVRRQLPELP